MCSVLKLELNVHVESVCGATPVFLVATCWLVCTSHGSANCCLTRKSVLYTKATKRRKRAGGTMETSTGNTKKKGKPPKKKKKKKRR